MRILFKLTSRSRRTNFLRAIDSVISNVTDKDNFHILISLDEDDETMKPLPVINCPHTYKVYKKAEGETITKISAINRDLNEFLEEYDAQIIVNLSDDQIFTVKGFDNVIRKEFIARDFVITGDTSYDVLNIKNLDLCLHLPDGVTNEQLISMSILGREYYNRDKYIYHSDYISLYCDEETMAVSKMRGCYKYVNNHIFKHLHPAHGNAPNDAQYHHTESFHPIDGATFQRRRANGFV